MAFWMRDFGNARHLHRVGDDGLIGADVTENALEVNGLKELGFAFGMRQLAGERDNAGKAFVLGIEQTVDQVQRSGANGPGAHTWPSANRGLCVRRVGCVLFVMDTDPCDAAVTAQGIGEGVQCVSCNTKNVSYAIVGQQAHQHLGNIHCDLRGLEVAVTAHYKCRNRVHQVQVSFTDTEWD